MNQIIIAYTSGIVLATYYFYYLVKEFNIPRKKFYNTRFLLLSLLFSFLIALLISYLTTGKVDFSTEIFVIPPIFIAFYFSVRTLIFIFKSQKIPSSHFKTVTLAGYIGVIFMTTMPFTVYFGDDQFIKVGLVNISFLITAFAFYKELFYKNRLEYQALKELGYFTGKDKNILSPNQLEVELFSEFNLTKRELEIAALIVKKLSYFDIGAQLNIEESTASKHASNIFRKTNCCSKKEFVATFSKKR